MGAGFGHSAVAALPDQGFGQHAFLGFGLVKNRVSVDDLVDLTRTLDAGDVVLQSWYDSTDAMAAQRSRWTHVALVYKRDGVHCRSIDKWNEENAKGTEVDEVCMMEAWLRDPGDVPPPCDNMNLTPRALPLRTRQYLVPDGKGPLAMGVRRLLNVERTPEFRRKLEAFWHEVKDRRYETDWWEKAKSALDMADAPGSAPDPGRRHVLRWSQNMASERELFCSELVALACRPAPY
eukprot:tig00020528_g9988.t2